MKSKRYHLGLLAAVLSFGFLFGCNGVDGDEPDPTEEPSEQQQENNNEDNQ
ncbi:MULTISPECIES: hypothetical protein [Virgibacillus]|nr:MULTISPECIES: hypothetical protein [Virgibacillus]MBS7429733.1 hypothetical protein [Virgibacillus sp. 19R1-5]MBU8565608.1 hypothetical protein [Virgibacillus pantothenticus]MBU8601310.1 hypothetical protein [Virgibacillus pantothenticus]MBU8635660.1 hypothetical protein [Virgibacillus pantothenticus]MBU8647400.1 hypothetical protein [Virgibacillus pantothenticus]